MRGDRRAGGEHLGVVGGLSRLVRPVLVAGTVAVTAFGALVAVPSSASAEPTGSAGFAELDVEVTEAAASIRVTVLRSGLAAAPGTVDYATRDGSARGGLDYGAAAGTVTFGVGEVAKSIAISLVDDRLVEQPERFEIALSNPRGAIGTVGAPVVVTIADDDARTAKGAGARQSADPAVAAGAAGRMSAGQATQQRRQVAGRTQSRPRRAARVAEPMATPFEVRTPVAVAPLPQPAATTGSGGLLALLASVLLGSVAARVWMRWLLARAELEAASVRS
jgi:hypothetical protein